MKARTDIHHLTFKASLLAISLFIMMSAVISPALPLMIKAFPTVSRLNVELLTTVPNLGMIVGLLISPFLIRKWQAKKVILGSLIVVGVAGSLPAILDNFYLIFISRVILGLGIGSYNSLAVSLIPQLYQGEKHELNQMIGFQNIMNNFGYVAGSLLICYLVTLSWHAVFLVYLFALPVLVAFNIFVNDLPQVGQSKNKPRITWSALRLALQPIILWIGLITLFIYIFYMALAYKLPSLIVDSGLGNESTVSFMLALLAFTGIPVSAGFDWFTQHLHQFVFPLCLAFNTGGYWLLSTAQHFWQLLAGCLIAGAGFGLVMPFIYKWIDLVSEKKNVNIATSFVLVMLDVGCAISPLVIALIDRSARGALKSAAIFFALLTIYGIFRSIIPHRQS